jgi:TBC1 domain family member 5
LPVSDIPPRPPLKQLRDLRQKYTNLLLEKTRAPDGTFVDGSVTHGSSVLPKKLGLETENLETNNPLSLDEKVYFTFSAC